MDEFMGRDAVAPKVKTEPEMSKKFSREEVDRMVQTKMADMLMEFGFKKDRAEEIAKEQCAERKSRAVMDDDKCLIMNVNNNKIRRLLLKSLR